MALKLVGYYMEPRAPMWLPSISTRQKMALLRPNNPYASPMRMSTFTLE